MRVIAGSAKRMPLKTIAGMDTRPTTDRIKETLFNMIAPYIPDCSFLDLFAGSGAIGIEALSRGAKNVVFIEQSKSAVDCINDNLKFTRLEAGARVMATDVITALKRLEGMDAFDYIFMDPPYQKELEKRVLEYLKDSKLLAKDGIIIVEASLETDFSYVDTLGFSIIKEKIYKTNKHVFLEKKEEYCA